MEEDGIYTLEDKIEQLEARIKELRIVNKQLRKNQLDILKRVKYSLNKLGKEATLLLIDQALKKGE